MNSNISLVPLGSRPSERAGSADFPDPHVEAGHTLSPPLPCSLRGGQRQIGNPGCGHNGGNCQRFRRFMVWWQGLGRRRERGADGGSVGGRGGSPLGKLAMLLGKCFRNEGLISCQGGASWQATPSVAPRIGPHAHAPCADGGGPSRWHWVESPGNGARSLETRVSLHAFHLTPSGRRTAPSAEPGLAANRHHSPDRLSGQQPFLRVMHLLWEEMPRRWTLAGAKLSRLVGNSAS